MPKHGDRESSRVLEAGNASQQREPVHLYLGRVKSRGIGKEGKFSRVAKTVILALRKKPGAFSLYALLMTYVSFNNKSSECYPGIATLAKELNVSVSTIRRNLRELIEQRLVKIRKKGQKTYYGLYTIPLNTATSATDTDQICEEYQSDLHMKTAGEGAVSSDFISDPETEESSEREPRKISIKEDVQASTSSSRRGKVKSLGISTENAIALIEQYGSKLIDAGVEHVLGREGVRNQAALFVSYLKNDGWARLDELKDFLYRMPDPRTPEEMKSVAWEAIHICDGSKAKALADLEEVWKDQRRLVKIATNDAHEQIAEAVSARARTVKHFIRRFTKSAKEEAESAELNRLMNEMFEKEEALNSVAL